MVVIRFVFADEKGVKQRPGLIISTDGYRDAREEVILAAITSNVHRLLLGDYRVRDWQAAGLLHPSVVTGILRTVKRDMIVSRLGALADPELDRVDATLREVLGL